MTKRLFSFQLWTSTKQRERLFLLFGGPLDPGTQGAQLGVNLLVTAVDLPDVADGGFLGHGQGGQHERHPGANVRTLDLFAVELGGAGDDYAVGVAKDDLCAHRDQLVREIHATW